MKKVKYYYSDAVHERLLPVITNAEGYVLYIPNVEPVRVKNLPRITVASVWDNKENTITFGTAICAPNDTFKKSVGRDLAYGRATKFPEITIKLTKRNRIREVSQKYAEQLISQHLHKYVRTDI